MASNNNNPVVKKTKGKQKIEMKKIEKQTYMMIAFSKRRSGIYKKVNELITLTGSEVGFLVFSPAGKPFSFGYPSFIDLAHRYMGQQQEFQPPYDQEMFRNARVQELNQTLNELLDLTKEAKDEEMTLKERLVGKPLNNWWNQDLEQVNVNELVDLEAAYTKMLESVEKMRMNLINLENNDGGVSGSHSRIVPHHHRLMNRGTTTTSSAHIVNQQYNMTPTPLIMSHNYHITAQQDGGIKADLDHPSSYGFPRADAFPYNPK